MNTSLKALVILWVNKDDSEEMVARLGFGMMLQGYRVDVRAGKGHAGYDWFKKLSLVLEQMLKQTNPEKPFSGKFMDFEGEQIGRFELES